MGNLLIWHQRHTPQPTFCISQEHTDTVRQNQPIFCTSQTTDTQGYHTDAAHSQRHPVHFLQLEPIPKVSSNMDVAKYSLNAEFQKVAICFWMLFKSSQLKCKNRVNTGKNRWCSRGEQRRELRHKPDVPSDYGCNLRWGVIKGGQ